MNKVEQISLQGAVFTVEVDAKEKLSNYLHKAKETIHDDDIATDVVTDLESSIAEHLQKAGFDRNRAVDANSMQAVIDAVGPIDEGDETAKPDADTWQKIFKEPFTPSNDKVIFGVCGALAERLEIDAIWIRVLFVIIAFITNFWFFLAYIAFGVLLDLSKPKSGRQYLTAIKSRVSDTTPKDGWRGAVQRVDRGTRQVLQSIVRTISIAGLIGTLSAGTALVLVMVTRNIDIPFIGSNRSSMAYALVISTIALALWFFVLLLQTAFFPNYKYSKNLVRMLLLFAPLAIFITMFITSAFYLRPTIAKWAEEHPNNHFLNITRDEKGNIKSSCFSPTASCDMTNTN